MAYRRGSNETGLRRAACATRECASRIVYLATGDAVKGRTAAPKDPAAVMLGRLGGLKGEKARAAKLSAKRRSEIGRKGAFESRMAELPPSEVDWVGKRGQRERASDCDRCRAEPSCCAGGRRPR
jgi:hypothetical protein